MELAVEKNFKMHRLEQKNTQGKIKHMQDEQDNNRKKMHKITITNFEGTAEILSQKEINNYRKRKTTEAVAMLSAVTKTHAVNLAQQSTQFSILSSK
jgi:hypothetical protein